MEAVTLINWINALAGAIPAVAQLVATSKATWSSDDLASVQAALDNLESQSDVDWARVRAELVAASAQ